jgi:hypothetical protein
VPTILGVAASPLSAHPGPGLAIPVLAGENMARGDIVYMRQAGGTDFEFWLAPTSQFNPTGTVFDASVSAGSYFLMTISGIGWIRPESGITAVRGYVAFVSASEIGRADQDAAAPASAVEHFREVGHFVEDGSGAGVAARGIIHFN